MTREEDNKRQGRAKHLMLARTVALCTILFTIGFFLVSTSILFNSPRLYHITPPYQAITPREMKMGTYVYDHKTVASDPRYMDDLALMVDRVLVDVSWGAVMRNSSYPDCFDNDTMTFYDEFFQNLSARGLGIVIQFSPTRSPPSWLNVSLEMNGYRATNPPQDPAERAFFIDMLTHYVNYTVSYFEQRPYFVELEWCLADEPHTADWADVFEAMATTIRNASNGTISLVLNKPELYGAFIDSFDMITIDPYGDDHDNFLKIAKAHADVNYSKPVRVIISGMKSGPGFDYQRIYRQMVISWFTGAHDMWFWSYNSRWDGKSNEWYVVLKSPDGPVHTERADAIINVRQDLKLFAEIDSYLKTGQDQALKSELEGLQEQAYTFVMKNNFPMARRTLLEAHALING